MRKPKIKKAAKPLESEHKKGIRASLSGARVKLLNIMTGLVWQGIPANIAGETVLKHPHPYRVGEEGLPDLGGWVQIQVVPTMLWHDIAVPLYVEVKRPGEKPEDHQLEKIQLINDQGGIAFWTDDPDDALRQLKAHILRIQRKPTP